MVMIGVPAKLDRCRTIVAGIRKAGNVYACLGTWYNRAMSSRVFFDVDPATLRLPSERIDGADPAKLQRQIARHGNSLTGMPPVLV
jgi:hypothetical protein